jgi:hypothetical protein
MADSVLRYSKQQLALQRLRALDRERQEILQFFPHLRRAARSSSGRHLLMLATLDRIGADSGAAFSASAEPKPRAAS